MLVYICLNKRTQEHTLAFYFHITDICRNKQTVAFFARHAVNGRLALAQNQNFKTVFINVILMHTVNRYFICCKIIALYKITAFYVAVYAVLACVKICNVHSLRNVKLTGISVLVAPVVIVNTVSGVGILLNFGNYKSLADCVKHA